MSHLECKYCGTTQQGDGECRDAQDGWHEPHEVTDERDAALISAGMSVIDDRATALILRDTVRHLEEALREAGNLARALESRLKEVEASQAEEGRQQTAERMRRYAEERDHYRTKYLEAHHRAEAAEAKVADLQSALDAEKHARRTDAIYVEMNTILPWEKRCTEAMQREEAAHLKVAELQALVDCATEYSFGESHRAVDCGGYWRIQTWDGDSWRSGCVRYATRDEAIAKARELHAAELAEKGRAK